MNSFNNKVQAQRIQSSDTEGEQFGRTVYSIYEENDKETAPGRVIARRNPGKKKKKPIHLLYIAHHRLVTIPLASFPPPLH